MAVAETLRHRDRDTHGLVESQPEVKPTLKYSGDFPDIFLEGPSVEFDALCTSRSCTLTPGLLIQLNGLLQDFANLLLVYNLFLGVGETA